MGKRRHSDSRYPRNPRRSLYQSPVHGSHGQGGAPPRVDANLKPPSREDLEAQEHVQVIFNGTAGFQSGSEGIDRSSYLFVLGSSPRPIIVIPIPSRPEPPASGSGFQPSTSSAPLSFSGSTPQVQPAHAAESLVESPESLTSVRRRRFLSPGLSRGTRKFLRRQYTLRTINQYAGARSRFSSFVKKKRIPRAEINESTVLNYLSSRLQDPERRRKGKLAPLSLRTVVWSPQPIVG